MSIDFADSDENTVSGDMTVPAKRSTDSLPELPDRSTLPDPSSTAPAAPAAPVTSAPSDPLPSAKFPVESDYIVQQIRIGRLALTVDNAEFVHAIQCGIEYARDDLQPPPRTTQELLNNFVEHLKECYGQGEDECAMLFGTILGEICHLVNGTKRLDFRLGPRPRRK
jgi:hypothetical protein